MANRAISGDVATPVGRGKGKRGNVALRVDVPPWLKTAAVATADQRGVTLAQLVREAVVREVMRP